MVRDKEECKEISQEIYEERGQWQRVMKEDKKRDKGV